MQLVRVLEGICFASGSIIWEGTVLGGKRWKWRLMSWWMLGDLQKLIGIYWRNHRWWDLKRGYWTLLSDHLNRITHHVTWKKVRHIPASQPIQTPVRLKRASSHRQHVLAPHLLYGISNNVTLDNLSTSPNATPGTYSAHTKCTHFPTSVSLKIPPAIEIKCYQYKSLKLNMWLSS